MFSYAIDKNKSNFDLTQLIKDYFPGKYTLNITAISVYGNSSAPSNDVDYIVIDQKLIWIRIRFIDSSYNPYEKQLATGLACTREDDIGKMECKKHFYAKWELIDSENNIWEWSVFSGTNISNAFATVNGDNSTPLLIDSDWLDSIPAIMGTLDGYSRELTEELVNNGTWPIVPESEFTGKVNIVDWDLTKATNTANMFGGLPWVSNSIYGSLPGFTTNSTNAKQMFSRAYHVTDIGEVEFLKTADLTQTFYSMTGLSEFPELVVQNNSNYTETFKLCAFVNSDVEDMFEYLYGTTASKHDDTFKQCGIVVDEHALDNVPVSWGGNARILAVTIANKERPIKAGDSIIKIY